jgi:hypothetical protein
MMKKVLVTMFAIFFLSLSFASASVYLRSVPARSNWVADGHTEYRMDVYFDSMDIPETNIAFVGWDIVIPSYLTVARTEIPPESDFFEGFDMWDSYNYVGLVKSNERESLRMVDIINHQGEGYGPSNRNAAVGSFWFTVSPSAPLGVQSFSTNGVFVADGYGNPLQPVLENQQYHIVAPEPAPEVGFISAGFRQIREAIRIP